MSSEQAIAHRNSLHLWLPAQNMTMDHRGFIPDWGARGGGGGGGETHEAPPFLMDYWQLKVTGRSVLE